MHASAVHAARLQLARDDDPGAPGAAITVALCGHWEHAGDCRWPHQTDVVDTGDGVTTVRTVFVSEASETAMIHDRISAALGRGVIDGPNGTTTWSVLGDGPADPSADEAALGARWLSQVADGT